MRAERVSFAAVRKVTEVQPKKERKQAGVRWEGKPDRKLRSGWSVSICPVFAVEV